MGSIVWLAALVGSIGRQQCVNVCGRYGQYWVGWLVMLVGNKMCGQLFGWYYLLAAMCQCVWSIWSVLGWLVGPI